MGDVEGSWGSFNVTADVLYLLSWDGSRSSESSQYLRVSIGSGISSGAIELSTLLQSTVLGHQYCYCITELSMLLLYCNTTTLPSSHLKVGCVNFQNLAGRASGVEESFLLGTC